MTDVATERARQACEQARARWTGLVVDTEAFIEYASPHCGEATQEGLRDLVLAFGCLNGDRVAIRHFEREVIACIGPAVARIDGRGEVIDEIQQHLRTQLLTGPDAKLGHFRGRGSLVAWVNVSAIRAALNLRRAASGSARRTSAVDPADPLAELVLAVDTLDVELELLKARFREAFSGAVRAACADLGDRDRALLRMQLVDGYGIDAIAGLYDVHRSTAARWMHRAREALHQAARMRLQASAGLDTANARMVERLLHTQLSVSFSGLSAST